MADELAQIFEFIAHADMAGSRHEPFRWGTAVFLPELPLRHDSNYLLVNDLPPEVDAASLAAEADRVQGGAGLAHRMLMFRSAAAGRRLRPQMERLGWTGHEGLVMVQREEPVRPHDLSGIRETDGATLYAAQRAHILTYPWSNEEVASQLLCARSLIPVPTRYFAAFEGGEPVSWAELYQDGSIGQIDAVATKEERRGEGLASAVVLRAAEAARASGADLVFLVADAEDWAWRLYQRLGFREVGRYVKLTRT